MGISLGFDYIRCRNVSVCNDIVNSRVVVWFYFWLCNKFLFVIKKKKFVNCGFWRFFEVLIVLLIMFC